MKKIPDQTVKTFARTIFHEAQKYGFENVDIVRLINALMDVASDTGTAEAHVIERKSTDYSQIQVGPLPIRSARVQLRKADQPADRELLESWIADQYGQYFLLSCSAARSHDVSSMLANPLNQIGIISLLDGKPIGAVAYLDVDSVQRRAELRKVIGVASERGKGYAEEATSLWIAYGREQLGLEKIYLSTLQTNLRNIQLNESIGFRVEGVLRGEILLGNERHDVLRMGLCFEPSVHED